MIARIWRGLTLSAKADEYLDYLHRTGLTDYLHTGGNRGVLVLRRQSEDQAEFLLVSFWDSLEAIRQFAGDEVEKARYYPEDQEYLLALEPHVAHYEVLVELRSRQE